MTGSLLAFTTVISPSRSPLWNTPTVRFSGPDIAADPAVAPGAAPAGQIAAGRGKASTSTQTSTCSAPVAPASTAAIRSSAVPASIWPAMSPAKSASTWYADLRSP